MKLSGEVCQLCFGCAAVCPQDAIPTEEKQVYIDLDRCNECGLCLKVCPVGAISE